MTKPPVRLTERGKDVRLAVILGSVALLCVLAYFGFIPFYYLSE